MDAEKIDGWPRLRVADWSDTRETLHMWTQIVGKVRMAHAPAVNHWWHVALYPSARGLGTSAIPYGNGVFDLEFDFVDHRLRVRTSDRRHREVALEPKPVAAFYAETMAALAGLGIATPIHAVPNEVDPAIPFAEDQTHRAYDGAAARLFWRQLLQAERVLGRFRAGFVGKASPVHFFWGAMDLAYTRPAAASYDRDSGEFLLPYEAVAGSPDPDRTVGDFLRSTYDAAADLGRWDREALEPGRAV